MPGTIARLLTRLCSMPVRFAAETSSRLGPIDRSRGRRDIAFESRLVSQMGGGALVTFSARYASPSSVPR